MKKSRVFWNTASENSTSEAGRNVPECVTLPGREKGDDLAEGETLSSFDFHSAFSLPFLFNLWATPLTNTVLVLCSVIQINKATPIVFCINWSPNTSYKNHYTRTELSVSLNLERIFNPLQTWETPRFLYLSLAFIQVSHKEFINITITLQGTVECTF